MLRRAFLGILVGAALLASSMAAASPALVFEPYNGTVFYSEDPDARWFPASLTKLMTAYVTFHALRDGEVTPETKVISTKNAAAEPPTKLGLPIGKHISLETAIKVIIVKSANDVAVMVAETVGGNEEAFIERMNKEAKHMGITNTPDKTESPMVFLDQLNNIETRSRLYGIEPIKSCLNNQV